MSQALAQNWVFALPGVFLIDRWGRRNLLLSTYPIMSATLLLTGFAFYAENQQVRVALVLLGIYLFGIAYSCVTVRGKALRLRFAQARMRSSAIHLLERGVSAVHQADRYVVRDGDHLALQRASSGACVTSVT
jgi:MFS family permease